MKPTCIPILMENRYGSLPMDRGTKTKKTQRRRFSLDFIPFLKDKTTSSSSIAQKDQNIVERRRKGELSD